MQTFGWWARPTGFLDRCRRKYGKRFTVRLTARDPFVLTSDPDEIKQIFTAPPDVLHPGEGTRILEPIVGPNSILLLDEGAHMTQRKLVLPAFHGERMRGLEPMMIEVTREQVSSWPKGESAPIHPRMQALTLEVILAAVFGVRGGERLGPLRQSLTEMLDFGMNPLSLLPPARRAPFGRGPWARFLAVRARTDELIYAEIRERRERGETDGSEIINSLIGASHEDGTAMSDVEIHDELLTLLVAGHETTATQLAWTLERLTREPRVLGNLVDAVDDGDGEPYLTAVIRESLRLRPVLLNAAPRTVKKPVEIGGIEYGPRVHMLASAWLVQHDPDIYPEPYAFQPERFLGKDPGTYTWIPFGGGRRRCVGASFAQLEMAIVLRELLRTTAVTTGNARSEATRRRAITATPARGAETILTARS